MNRAMWTTYRITGYTYQAGTDARATGGVHLHQVRRHARGGWQSRVMDANGRFASPGAVQPIDERDGEARYASA